ncbi:ABC transporter substrate-binding protein [Bradyrhizobium sp. KBS0727]|uniref:ABC transporter substrate-binding protein n=1 Tax=unclassified Bradyrhizobium TaxID=2631580 RepID=UPI00110D35F0|nr:MULTISPECIES: ABC transporter substrate-binding protein [unclassified Bradyrhizobium]QDW39892.1 ABC transporter substrate-binding protein [Bradyrhizobium sp. KBS0725]QDW46495.1 ABC transporter substrate-binding protein [Bradyrhizobium sp. KBS0727]
MSYSINRKASSLLRFAFAVVGSIQFLSASATAQPLEVVKIGWPAGFASNMAHLTFGNELGFFKEEGLDYEIVSMQGTFPVIQQILSGGFHTGYVGVETVVNALQPGATPIPLRFVFNYTRQSIWEIVVPENSPIKTLADLKGKTIGIAGPTFGNVPVTKAALGTVGVQPNQYSLFTVGTGGPAFRALTTGQVDALNLWDTMHATLEASGQQLREISFPTGLQGNPSHGFAATEELMKTRPEFVARFGRAIAKGIVACDTNLEECIRSFWRAYPAQKPQVPESEAMAKETKILAARMKKLLYFGPGEKPLLGSFTDDEWRGVIKSLKLGGVISVTDLPMDKLYTNRFVAEFNKFDRADVIKRAKAATK